MSTTQIPAGVRAKIREDVARAVDEACHEAKEVAEKHGQGAYADTPYVHLLWLHKARTAGELVAVLAAEAQRQWLADVDRLELVPQQ
jgi:hypothetical protein